MATTQSPKRQALRDSLIAAAEAEIARSGIHGLRARSLAAEVGCAVGSIYTVFDDLTDLTLAVNGRTFRRLGAWVARSLDEEGSMDPSDRLVTIGQAYATFAVEEQNLWRALFELEMNRSSGAPDWYIQELSALFGLISGPLSEVFPDYDTDQVRLMTRALFSSVHGIVSLGLEDRISAVPPDQVEHMIRMVLEQIFKKK